MMNHNDAANDSHIEENTPSARELLVASARSFLSRYCDDIEIEQGPTNIYWLGGFTYKVLDASP